ncbi:membrane-bound metal-dependent hydrolase YbcI (DUF457 family) [Desulfitispora alkaliphila]
MRWKTHRAIGVFTYSTVITSLYQAQSKLFGFILLALAVIPFYSSILPDKLDSTFDLEHRGFTHSFLCSLVATAIFFLPVVLLHFYLKSLGIYFPILIPLIGFYCGYLFHLIADSFTDNGIHFLWPINKDQKRQPLYRLWYYSDGYRYEFWITIFTYILTFLIWKKFMF